MRLHVVAAAGLTLLALPGAAAAQNSDDNFRLQPVPAQVRRTCHEAQSASSWQVLCPARLPRASIGHPGQPPEPLRARVLDDRKHFLGVEFYYGAPYETEQWRNHPHRFLHLAVLRAGSSLAAPPGGSTRLGTTVLGGRRGDLIKAPTYFEGGGYHGNHFLFTWREGRTTYTISLHAWSEDETLRFLESVIEVLEPAASLPRPPERELPPSVTRFRVGNQPAALVAEGESVWVSLYQPAGRVVQVSLNGEVVGDPIPVGRYPWRGMAADADDVWVVTDADAITRIDARTAEVIAKGIPVGRTPYDVAIGTEYVWVANLDDGTLSRVDPASNDAVGDPVKVGGGPNSIAVAEGSVWVTDFDRGDVVRVDEASGDVTTHINVGRGLSGIAATAGAIWVTDFESDTLVRIDPSANEIVGKTAVGSAPSGVVVRGDSLWVTDYWDGTLRRVSARTGEVVEEIWIGGKPWQVAAGPGAIWVLDHSRITRVVAPQTGAESQERRSDSDSDSLWIVAPVVLGLIGIAALGWFAQSRRERRRG